MGAPLRLDAQFPAKLEPLFKPSRYKIMHGGRGSGKSWAAARALLLQAAQAPLRVLCAREVQKSIKESVHSLLNDQIQALGLGSFYQVLETEIRGANGSKIIFAGLANHTTESIKSYEGIDRVWIEEAQTVSKKSWDILIPTIRKPDSEIWLTLNPWMETDETYVRFVLTPPPDSWVQQINYADNPWFPDVLEKEREHCERSQLREDYENIWLGKPLIVAQGAIYKGEIEALTGSGRIRQVPYDPTLSVHTVWDLGWNDAMTIAFVQRGPMDIRIIDYIEDSHHTLDWYVAEIEKRPYRWGNDYLPHDGRTRNFQTGKSTEDLMRAMGRRPIVLAQTSVEEGIKACRMLFPRVYFDSDKTTRLVECLKRYRRAIHAQTGEPMGPLHDEHSHGADCFRYIGQSVEIMPSAVGESDYTPREAPDWRL